MSKGMLATNRPLYLTFFDLKNGRMRVRFDTVEPTGAGAMVAMLSRGKLTRDISNVEFEIVTDPTTDTALRGTDGKSAYQIARDKGYGGTETQWLTTLAGGEGKSAYQIARESGYGGTQMQWLASLKGADATTLLGTITISERAVIAISAGTLCHARRSASACASSRKYWLG